jgi:hypothetical protein
MKNLSSKIFLLNGCSVKQILETSATPAELKCLHVKTQLEPINLRTLDTTLINFFLTTDFTFKRKLIKLIQQMAMKWNFFLPAT